MRGLPLLLVVSLVLPGLSACQRPQAAVVLQAPATAAVPRPVATTGVLCPIETVNGTGVRSTFAVAAGSAGILTGWSTVADPVQPVSPSVQILFRSALPDGSTDLAWAGKRVARPELSSEPARLEAGIAASGNFPALPGVYHVLVRVEGEQVIHECDSRLVVETRSPELGLGKRN